MERVAKIIGYPIRPSNVSDATLIGIGIFFGAIVGLVSIRVGEIPVSLSTSGGTLLAGLISGWLRSVHPNFGNIPGAGLWVFNNVGLSMFAAVVAIQACAGARASSVALSVIEDAANSRVAALGFTVCFAVSNTLLTIGGLVIVLLLQ